MLVRGRGERLRDVIAGHAGDGRLLDAVRSLLEYDLPVSIVERQDVLRRAVLHGDAFQGIERAALGLARLEFWRADLFRVNEFLELRGLQVAFDLHADSIVTQRDKGQFTLSGSDLGAMAGTSGHDDAKGYDEMSVFHNMGRMVTVRV